MSRVIKNNENFYDIDKSPFFNNYIKLINDIIGENSKKIIFSSKRLNNIIGHFDDIGEKVILLYYGLNSGYGKTLRKVGSLVGYSQTCIMEIKRELIKFLSNPYIFNQFCFTEEYLLNNCIFFDKIDFSSLKIGENYDDTMLNFLVNANDLRFEKFNNDFNFLNLSLDAKNTLIYFNIFSVSDFIKLDNNMITKIFNYNPSAYFELKNGINLLSTDDSNYVNFKLKDMGLLESKVDFSNITLDKFGFSGRTLSALRYASINNLKDLLMVDYSKLYSFRKLGKVGVEEIVSKLKIFKSCLINDDFKSYGFDNISFENDSDIINAIDLVKKNNAFLIDEIGEKNVLIDFYSENVEFGFIKKDNVSNLYDVDNSFYSQNYINFIKDIDYDAKNAIFSSSVIRGILSSFDKRDEDIVVSRYGLDDGSICSLGILSDKYNLSRQGVDYVCNKVINDLKNLKNDYLFTKKNLVDKFLLTRYEKLIIEGIDDDDFSNNYDFIVYLLKLSDERNVILNSSFSGLSFNSKALLSHFGIFSKDVFDFLNSYDATNLFNYNPFSYYEVKESIDKSNGLSAQSFFERLSNNNLNILFNNVDYNAISLENLGLSNRSLSILLRSKIYSLNDLINLSSNDLKNIRSFGDKCFSEVVNMLSLIGLNLKDEKEDNSSYEIPHSRLLYELEFLKTLFKPKNESSQLFLINSSLIEIASSRVL